MKRIVLDTNRLFAALRSRNRYFRELLFSDEYTFYSSKFIVVEIFKHKERILSKAKGSDDEVIELLILLTQQIHFVAESQISTENLIYAFRLCKGEDEKDTLFVALALEHGGIALDTR